MPRFLRDLRVFNTSSDSKRFVIFVFPKQRDEIRSALMEIDLSPGTDNFPIRDLLFNDLRVKIFFIVY